MLFLLLCIVKSCPLSNDQASVAVLSNSEGKTCSMCLDSNYFRGGLNSYYSLLLLRALYPFGYSVPLMDGMRESAEGFVSFLVILQVIIKHVIVL